MASSTCEIRIGLTSAASKVPWSSSAESRRVSDWLPRIDEAPIDKRTGLFTPRWYNYLRVLGDRLGGIDGPSITVLNSSLSDTQGLVASTANYTAQVADYAQGIGATATATAQVAQQNNLSGSGSIPPTPPRPVNKTQQEL